MQVKVIIECLKGSNEKFEFDEKDRQIKLDFVFQNLTFPFYYGYIPGTRAGDGDMLDAVVVSSGLLNRGQEVECNLLGYVEVVDRGEEDNKFVLEPVGENNYSDINDIPKEIIEAWKNFWQEVARQKNKIMVVKALHNREEALIEIKNIKH